MPDETQPTQESTEQATVIVRYWAGAKAAAGTDHDVLPVPGPLSLAEVTARAAALHPGRLGSVLEVCSVLLGENPAGTDDPADVVVAPGTEVQYLPPFAGG